MSFLRYVLGPNFQATKPTAPAPQGATAEPIAPARLDVVPVIGPVDQVAWTIPADIPAYDLAVQTTLAEIRVYLAPSTLAGPALPTDGPAWVASSFPFGSEDVSAYQTGARADIPLPDVPTGVPYFGQIVFGYRD